MRPVPPSGSCSPGQMPGSMVPLPSASIATEPRCGSKAPSAPRPMRTRRGRPATSMVPFEHRPRRDQQHPLVGRGGEPADVLHVTHRDGQAVPTARPGEVEMDRPLLDVGGREREPLAGFQPAVQVGVRPELRLSLLSGGRLDEHEAEGGGVLPLQVEGAGEEPRTRGGGGREARARRLHRRQPHGAERRVADRLRVEFPRQVVGAERRRAAGGGDDEGEGEGEDGGGQRSAHGAAPQRRGVNRRALRAGGCGGGRARPPGGRW